MAPRLARVLALALAVSGCQRDTYEDLGSICASLTGQPGDIVLVIDASSEDCSGQDRNSELECEVTVNGTNVEVSTTLYKGQDRDSGCGPELTSCSTVISPGTYTLRYGDQSSELLVPSADSVCLSTKEGS